MADMIELGYSQTVFRLKREIDLEKNIEENIQEDRKSMADNTEENREGIEENKRKEPEKIEKNGKFLIMARNLNTIERMMTVLNCSRASIYDGLKRNGIYSREEVISLLDTQTDEQIANNGNVNIRTVARLREERKREKFLMMAKNLNTIDRMMTELNCSGANIYDKLRRNGIYSRKKVISLLDTQTDEQIANDGKVNIVAVVRVREEINLQKRQKEQEILQAKLNRKKQNEQEKIKEQQRIQAETARRQLGEQQKNQEQTARKEQKGQEERQAEIAKREQEKRREEEKFIKMARNLTDPRIISNKLGKRIEVIYGRLEYYGFYTKKDVVSLLNKFSDEEIAVKGKLSKEAVKKVRKEEQRKEAFQNTPEALNRTLNQQRSEILKQNEFLRTAKKYRSIEEWEQKSGVSQYEIILGIKRLIRKGMASTEQINLINEWETRRAAKKVPIKKREIDLKIEIMKLRTYIKNTDVGKNKERDIINYSINRILVEYENILKESDYALIAYAYMKIREFYKGIELSKNHLGLKDISINGVRERIKDIINDGEERKDTQLDSGIKASVGKEGR